jgi:type IX secretion system PorP/SprF family membrane protein
MKNIFVFILFILLINCVCFSQDPLLTQHFSNPLTINPAYAGSLDDGRLALNLHKEFSFDYFSGVIAYDQKVDKLHGGLGMVVFSEIFEDAVFMNHSADIHYSYHMNVGEHITIRPALNIGFFAKYIDWESFSGINTPSSNWIQTFNIGSGVIVGYKNIHAGISADHLNYQDIGYFSSYRRELRWTAHCHYNYTFNEEAGLNAGILIGRFEDYKYFFPSVMLQYRFLKAGIGYRSFINSSDYMSAMAGFSGKRFSAGYSVDFISRLSKTYYQHELSVVYAVLRGDSEPVKPIIPLSVF